MNSKQTFETIFKNLLNCGKECKPRELKIIEQENFCFSFDPFVRFMNFKSRKYNLGYVKKEFLWYLKADKYDTSICEHAKLWKTLVKKDGSINSNYGQYIFSENSHQFNNVVSQLVDDKDSRRAAIVILKNEHILSDDKDLPCTYSLSFRIRENKLNMSVHMRSQDCIFGLGSDLPTFSFIHEMVYVSLRDIQYKDLQMGNYFHNVDSFHVYERHFEMIKNIASGNDEYIEVECPKISSYDEVMSLLYPRSGIPKSYQFIKWLYE